MELAVGIVATVVFLIAATVFYGGLLLLPFRLLRAAARGTLRWFVREREQAIHDARREIESGE